MWSRAEAVPWTPQAPAAEVGVFPGQGADSARAAVTGSQLGVVPTGPWRGGGGLGEPAGEAVEGAWRPAPSLSQPRLLSPDPSQASAGTSGDLTASSGAAGQRPAARRESS